LIALLTGMRRSEIARLRWDYIDLDGRTLNVPTTKNGDPLELPLSNFLHELLVRRRDDDPEGEWVFPGRGETGHMVETKKFYARVTKSSGIRFTLHDLRRTFVTIAESLDIPHYALKRLLNHRGANDVTAGYIIIDVERLRGPVERVAQRILELANERGPISLVA
jgi:integrase